MELSDVDIAGIQQGAKDGYDVNGLAWIYGVTPERVRKALNEKPAQKGDPAPADPVNG